MSTGIRKAGSARCQSERFTDEQPIASYAVWVDWMMRTISASRGLCLRDKVPNLWLKAVGRNLSCRLFHLSKVNPFTASACKISGLKGTYIHACKQSIWWYYNKSTFNTVHFDRNPFKCSSEGGKKGINNFQFGTFIGRFKSDSAASMAVKGLKEPIHEPFRTYGEGGPVQTSCVRICPS